MVLEKLVSKLLGKYLGQYIEGVDKKSLKISLISGEVKLKNLLLQKSALDDLNLPIKIKFGLLENLFLKIPWRKLSKEPVFIKLEGIYLIVGPKEREEDAETINAQKRRRLQTAELFGLDTIPEDDDKSQKENEVSDSFFEKLKIRAINNIQVSVEKVHIRYEDSISENPFSFGVSIEGFHAQTVDDQWKPIFIKEIINNIIIKKLVELKNLSVYLDTRVDQNILLFNESLANKKGLEYLTKLARKMDSLIAKENLQNTDHTFIIHPLSCQLQFLNDENQNQRLKTPITSLKFLLEKLNVSLNREQYLSLMGLLKFLTIDTSSKVLVSKPEILNKVRPSQNPNIWWSFLIECAVHLYKRKREQFKWENIIRYRKATKEYVELFKLSKQSTIDKKKKKRLEELEDILSYDDIIYYRKSAYKMIRKEKLLKKENKKGFFSSLFGDSKKSIINNKDAMKEIYNVIEFDEKADNKKIVFPKDYIKTTLNFIIKYVSVQLIESENDPSKVISTLEIDDVGLTFSFRDNNSLSALATVLNINLYQNLFNKKKPIIYPCKEVESLKTIILNADINTYDTPEPVDLRIISQAQPFNVIVTKPIIQSLIQFFKLNKKVVKKNLVNLTSLAIDMVKDRATSQLKNMINSTSTLILDIRLPTPKIIIDISETQQLIASLGNTFITCDTSQKLKSIPENIKDISKLDENLIYEQYNLKTSGISIYFSNPDSKKHYIIDEFDMNFSLRLRSLKSIKHPKVYITSNIGLMKFYVSRSSIESIITAVIPYLNLIEDNKKVYAPVADQNKRIYSGDTFFLDEILGSESESESEQETPFKIKKKRSIYSLLKTSINLEGIRVNILESKNESLNMISVVISQITSTMDRTTDYFDLYVSLSQLYIEDNYASNMLDNKEKSLRYLIHPQKDSKLISLTLRNIYKSSELYNLIDNELKANLSNIEISVNRLTLAELLLFLNDIAKVISKSIPKSKAIQDTKVFQPSNTLMQYMEPNTLITISAGVEEVKINLTKESSTFFTISARDFGIDINAKGNGVTYVSGAVRSVQGYVIDDFKWNKLIETTGGHVGKFSITLYDEKSPARENYDIHFKSSIESIRIIVMSKTIEEIATYFLEFLKILTFIGYPETKDSIIRLSVHINNPLVIIPISSNSDDYFKINLGNTEIKSMIKDIDKNQFNDINILLTKFNLSSCKEIESKEVTEVTVIDDITLSMSILQLLNQTNANKDTPSLNIKGCVNDIKINVTDFFISKVSQLMKGNIIEEIPRKDNEVVDLVKQMKQMDLSIFQEMFGNVEKTDSSFKIIHFSANKVEIILSKFEQNMSKDFLLLKMTQLASEINTFQDESVRIKAGIRSIQIDNIQSDLSKDYRCILKPHHDFGDKDHFALYFDLYPNEKIQFLTFELQQSKIFVVNSFILSFAPFILSLITPLLESLDSLIKRDTSSINEYLQLLFEYKLNKLKQEHSRILKQRMKNQSRLMKELGNVSLEIQETAKYQNANEIRMLRAQFKREIDLFCKTKGSSENEMVFKVQIYSPEIYIVDDNHQAMLNLVVHLGDSMLKYSSSLKNDKIKLFIYDFKACKCIVEKETQKLIDEKILIRPFDVSIVTDITKEDKNTLTHIDLNISELIIGMSYHDIKLSLGFYQHFIDLIDNLYKNDIDRMQSLEMFKQTTPKVQKEPNNDIITADISLRNLEVNVINDLDLKCIIPLVKFYIQNLRGKINLPSNKTSFKLTGLELDTYNSDINSFEPFIEPIDILLSILSKDKVSDIYAEALTPINLNLSKSCIDTGIAVSIMSEKILKAFQKKALTKTSKNVGLKEYKSETKTPYILRNETGYNITITLFEYDQVKTFHIKNMESLSFNVLKKMDNISYLIDVIIEYETDKIVLQKIPIDIVQYRVYDISQLNVKFVSEIIREDGVKVIIIRTPNVFNNQTPYELEIVYATEHRETFILPPYSKRSINCLAIYDSFLIRPYNKNYHYSNCNINSSTLVCMNENDERWTCYMEKKNVTRNNEEEIELTFKSVLVFENLLPVIIVLKSDGDTQMFDASISPGNAYEIYETKFKNPMNINYIVQIGGHRWSPTIHTNIGDETTDKEINIEDLNNQSITFFLHYETINEKCKKISLYSKYWIINQTGLFLNYKSSNRKNYVTDYFKDIALDADPITWYKDDSNLKAHKVFFYDKDISIQVGSYNLCSPYINITKKDENIDEKKLAICDSASGIGFYFTLSLSNVLGKLWRTKEIRIVPSFIIANKSKFDIKYRQVGCKSFVLYKDKNLPFHWPNSNKPKEMEISILGDVWSQPFRLISPSNFIVKLLNMKEKQASLISVNIYEESGITFITFSPGSFGIAHFNIHNKTMIDLGIKQPNTKGGFLEKIQKLSSIQYHLDDVNSKEVVLAAYEDNALSVPLVLNSETNYNKIAWKVGKQQLYVTLSCNDIFRKLTIEDPNIEDIERPSKLDFIFTSLSLYIPQIGISIIEQTKEKTLKELFYISFRDITGSLYNNYQKSSNLSLTIKQLQIDQNYLHPNKPIFWGIFTNETPNFLSIQSTINKDITSEIILLENLTIETQQIEVSLTTDMIVLLSSFIEETINYIITQKGLTTEILSSESYLPEIRSGVLDKLFFRNINIDKIKIIFSLLRDARRINKKSVLGVAVNILTILLKISTISRANLGISSFKHSQKIQSSHYILETAAKHFKSKFQSQIKKILLTYVKSIFVANKYPITPIRPPRYFLQGIVISKFDIQLSYGQYLLNEFSNREYYLFHEWINKNCILGSNKRLYCLANQRLVWSENSENLKMISSKDLKIKLHFYDGNAKSNKVIEIDCKTTNQVEKIVHELDVITKMNKAYILNNK